MKWIYNDDEFDERLTEEYVGFVYRIYNEVNKREYYGKKLFWFSKTKQVKKKKKRYKIESDWKEYYSSSDELVADVKKYGKDKFYREIIKLCHTKAQMTYWEAKYQFQYDVLLSDKYYNRWIMCRIRKTKSLN